MILPGFKSKINLLRLSLGVDRCQTKENDQMVVIDNGWQSGLNNLKFLLT